MANEPFFTRDGDKYVPTGACRGPWDPKSLHGRVIIGLLAREIELKHGDPEFLPARLTVDMYRLPDLSPIEVTTKVIRDGNRIRVVDGEFFSNGVSMARASVQFLRRTENSPGEVWRPEGWDAPHPDRIELPEGARNMGMGGMWAMRPISGGFGGPPSPRKKTWMAEVREMVEGSPWTPFQRVAIAADFASPFANAGTEGLGYINSDVTVYLHRLPVTEWVGFEVVNHGATDGVAIGECFLHDVDGPIGSATVAALAQRRRAPAPPPPADAAKETAAN